MSDIQENQEQQAAGEQGNVQAPPSSDTNGSNAGDQAPPTPVSAVNSSPETATATTPAVTPSESSTASNTPEGDAGNGASGASTETAASGTSAPGAEGAPGNAASSDGAGSTPPAGSAGDTGSSSSPSSVTNVIPQGTLVNGSVVNTAQSVTPANPTPVAPVIAPSSMPTTVGVVPPGPGTAVNPAPAAPAVNFVQSGLADVDQIVERLMKDCSTESKLIINAIKEYVVKMKPGKVVSTKEGAQNQVGLYQAFLSAINNVEGNDFRPTIQSILALLHAHRDGAFRETHVFRFVEHVALSAEHRKGFQKITTLLKTLANPATRSELVRQINFDPIVKYGLTERGRAKLAAFFGK